jgi:integrase
VKSVLKPSFDAHRHTSRSQPRSLLAQPFAVGYGAAENVSPGEAIDTKYLIVRQLGQGGMGAVYEARHAGTGRRVAVKVIVGETLQKNRDVVARFQREARAAGAIESAHVVQVLDTGSIAKTCSDECEFKGGACMILAGATKGPMAKLDAAAEGLSGSEVIWQEGDLIRRAFSGRRIRQDGGRDGCHGRDLRFHTGGDATCEEDARLLAATAADWCERGGGTPFTFTRSWRRISCGAWGCISVLASVRTVDEGEEAKAAGYTPAITLERFPSTKPFRLRGSSLLWVPCPHEVKKTALDDKRRATGMSRDQYEAAHARPWYVFAGRKITNVPSEKLDKDVTAEERKNLAELGRKLALIDAADERFVDAFTVYRRANEIAEHTIAHDRGTFRAALKLAKRARIWSGDIGNIFQRFELGYEPVQHWVSHEDAAKLLDAVILPNRKAYVSFILATGAELAAVERAQRSDTSPDMVRVRGTKNAHRDRLVPVVTQWQKDLLTYVVAHADGEDGLLFTPWMSALRSIKQACIRAKVQHMNRHALRHTFAHWMKQEGVQHSELHVAMGHATTMMLDRIYGRAEGAELASAMAGSIAVRRAALTVIEGGKSRKTRQKATG